MQNKAFKICCALIAFRFQKFFRLKAQFYTLNLILLHFHWNIDKFRACLANYSLFFSLKLQKTQYLHCAVKFRLRKLGCALTWNENTVPQLRCASTESKTSLRKLRCASESKKIKLRILRGAFTGRKDRCAFDIMLFVPTSAPLLRY